MHHNVPNILSQISTAISGEGSNIENMLSRSRGDFAYTIVDVTGNISDDALAKIKAVDGIIRINVIK